MKFGWVLGLGLLVAVSAEPMKRGCSNCCCSDDGLVESCVRVQEQYGTTCCECKKKGSCFPETSMVRLSNGDEISMKQLKTGDSISTVNKHGALTQTEVVAFLKHDPNMQSIYKHILTDAGNDVTLSPDHLIVAAKSHDRHHWKSRFAEEVEVGDFVQNADGESERVIKVDLDLMQGAYVPLTKEGTLLVDNIFVSCYASVDHDLLHFFVTPMRWFSWLADAEHNEHGMPTYISWIKAFGKWVLPQGIQSKPNLAWALLTSPWQTAA